MGTERRGLSELDDHHQSSSRFDEKPSPGNRVESDRAEQFTSPGLCAHTGTTSTYTTDSHVQTKSSAFADVCVRTEKNPGCSAMGYKVSVGKK